VLSNRSGHHISFIWLHYSILYLLACSQSTCISTKRKAKLCRARQRAGGRPSHPTYLILYLVQPQAAVYTLQCSKLAISHGPPGLSARTLSAGRPALPAAVNPIRPNRGSLPESPLKAHWGRGIRGCSDRQEVFKRLGQGEKKQQRQKKTKATNKTCNMNNGTFNMEHKNEQREMKKGPSLLLT